MTPSGRPEQRTYAVSTVTQTRGGGLQHTLCIIEAASLDAAEARVLARSLQGGRTICGLLSRACGPEPI
ncbi:hypothetical protein [Caulobacter sp. S45]|uniref:hypothetical protein n=1 Tax=Caulobacter sp. S45 TaxID=1641861 RepID=UPI00157644D9|nr:hypothetical protein [Caulobacter sp. S45]